MAVYTATAQRSDNAGENAVSFIDRLTGRVSGLLDDVMLPDDVRTALIRSQKAIASGEHAEALRLLDPIVNRKAGAARIDELRGTALAALGRHEEAVEALRSAAAARPTPEVFLKLGQVLFEQGAPEDARRAFRESLEGEPPADVRFRARRALAQVYVSRNRPDRGVRELRKALAVESDELGEELGAARIELATCLLSLDRVDEAEAALAPIAGDPAAAATEARILARRGLAPAALARFEAALLHQPGPELSLDAAASALDAGELDRAAGLLEGLGADAVATVRGRIAFARGDAQGALDLLTDALVRHPDDPAALGAAGWAALELGDVSLATQRFHHQLTVTRGDAEALEGLGACHAAAGELGTARRQLAAAVEQGAGLSARTRLAQVLIDAGDPAAAVETLTAAEADPDGDKVQDTLALAYARLATPVTLPAVGTRNPAALLQSARALHDRIGAAAHLAGLRERAAAILDALDAPLDVAILGEFNAGKSTLVNALVGEVIVPTGVLPTTAHIDVLRFGPRRAAQLHLHSGEIEEIALRDVKGRVKRDAGSIHHIEYLYPHPTLRRVNFWDTPGFNALDDEHERQAAEALDRAEAIVWVLDATQALAETELTHLERIHNASERLVVVINKIDRLGASEVDEVVEHVGRALSAIGCVGVYPISALAAVEAKTGRDAQDSGDDSGLDTLTAALEEHIFDRAGSIKCVDGVVSLHALAADVRSEANARGESLEAAATAVDEIGRRIQAEQTALRETFVPGEMARLEGAFELLVDVVLREVDETAQPGNRLLDTLFVRPRLDEEDLEFVLGFLEARYDDVLARSAGRVEAQLRETDAVVAQGADGLMRDQSPEHRRLISRRVRDWLDRAAAQRRLLTERVHGRYVAIARGRASAPGAERLLREAARMEPGDDRRAKLRDVMPESGGLADAIVSEGEEYFAMTVRFCDTLRADLLVLAIEARAMATGLEITS